MGVVSIMKKKSNFRKRPPKVPVCIKVDQEVIKEARKNGLNISKICRYALKLAIAGKLVEEDNERTGT